MKQVNFGNLSVGDFFKESDSDDSCWIMKDSKTTAIYQSKGVHGQPIFQDDEIVYVN